MTTLVNFLGLSPITLANMETGFESFRDTMESRYGLQEPSRACMEGRPALLATPLQSRIRSRFSAGAASSEEQVCCVEDHPVVAVVASVVKGVYKCVSEVDRLGT
jgi:hypothetical protein